jgi:hypothetical protein
MWIRFFLKGTVQLGKEGVEGFVVGGDIEIVCILVHFDNSI